MLEQIGDWRVYLTEEGDEATIGVIERHLRTCRPQGSLEFIKTLEKSWGEPSVPESPDLNGRRQSIIEYTVLGIPESLCCNFKIAAQAGFPMHEINIREMRSSIGKLDRLVDEAGELIITRHGKAIARILPVHRQRKRPSHSDLRNRMMRLETGSETLIRNERDED